MVELLSVIGVVVVAAAVLSRPAHGEKRSENKRRAWTTKAASNLGAVLRVKGSPTKSEPEVEEARAGAGTHAAPRDGRFAFVAGFGVRPEQLKELHIYAVAGSLEQFPRKVRELLRRLYANGYAVGEEIMALLHHGRPLKEGEAIYVAVARDERADTTRTVAFLDRRRAC